MNEMKKIRTTSKTALFLVLIVCLFDMQLTYVLAFLGMEQIAEALSSTIADTIVASLVAYFAKAFLETFAEKREERLARQIDLSTQTEELGEEPIE